MPELSTVLTEVWESPRHDEYDEIIARVKTRIDSEDYDELMARLQSRIERSESGISYAVIAPPDRNYSDTQAIVRFTPIGNGLSDNMLVQTELLRLMAEELGVVDEQGRLLPVIVAASPGIKGSQLNLTRTERREVKNGNLGLVAEKLLEPVRAVHMGRLAVRLVGDSLGADLALAGAARKHEGLDVISAVAADPAGVKDRKLGRLMLDFMNAKPGDLKRDVASSGIEAQKRAWGSGWGEMRRFLRVSLMRRDNYTLRRSLTHNSLADRLLGALRQSTVERLVLAHGDRSAIAQTEAINEALNLIQQEPGTERILSIQVPGSHPWTNDMDLMLRVFARAFAQPQANKVS